MGTLALTREKIMKENNLSINAVQASGSTPNAVAAKKVIPTILNNWQTPAPPATRVKVTKQRKYGIAPPTHVFGVRG